MTDREIHQVTYLFLCLVAMSPVGTGTGTEIQRDTPSSYLFLCLVAKSPVGTGTGTEIQRYIKFQVSSCVWLLNPTVGTGTGTERQRDTSSYTSLPESGCQVPSRDRNWDRDTEIYIKLHVSSCLFLRLVAKSPVGTGTGTEIQRYTPSYRSLPVSGC